MPELASAMRVTSVQVEASSAWLSMLDMSSCKHLVPVQFAKCILLFACFTVFIEAGISNEFQIPNLISDLSTGLHQEEGGKLQHQ